MPVVAASAPAGKWPVVLLEIPDLNGGAPLRYANDLVDWTVTLEAAAGGGVVTFPSTGHRAGAPAADDTASQQVEFEVPDVDAVLWRRIRANIGGTSPMVVIHRTYWNYDTSAPVQIMRLELSSPQRAKNGLSISFTGRALDPINRDAGMSEFTFASSPGLRGRR